MTMNTKLKLSLLLLFWAGAFAPVYPDLIHTWLNHSDNTYGILIPFISLYLIWKKRDKLREMKLSNSNWGALILVVSIALYLLSYAGSVAVVARSMIVFSLIGLVLFTMGKVFFKALAFPLLFLLFMVPVPDSVLSLVSFPLQLFATKVSTSFMQALSVPTYREGNMLYFAQTQLEVAEACSGIRSMMSLTMSSVILVYFLDGRATRKAILLASAIPLSLFANVVRVSGTGILAHFYGDKVARGFIHEFSGIVVFAFGFILLYLEYLLLNRGKVTS